jgi:peptidoglycan/xylan/chitin deacetylase (PgdA/CDA1 family)
MNRSLICYPGGKAKVLTMSYDDGKLADRRLVSIFNKYGIKGTFHINGGKLGDEIHIKPEEVTELYKGHEVSGHTYDHPTIARCNDEQIVAQIIEDRKILEKLVGYPVRGLSYPNGSYNQKIVSMVKYLGVEYSRVVEETQQFDLPQEFCAWKPTCHHNHRLLELGKEFVEFSKSQYLKMLYVWGHSYEFDKDDNWDVIEDFCKLVSGKDDIWYATNIEIVEYFKAFNNLKFTAEGDIVYNPNAISIWLSVSAEGADKKIVEVKAGETKKIH